MLSKADSRKKGGGVSGHGRLLSDIEAINKTFYSDKTLSRLATSTASSRAKSVAKSNVQETKSKPDDSRKSVKDSFDKDKKASIWSWKGLKALTQVRNRRFNCCFSLQVHSVDGLPSILDGLCLVVHWRRRDSEQMTRPVRVCKGVAEFEDQLTHSCSVYGSRSGPHHSAKYEAKHCLLFVSVYDSPQLDLGKHRVDLTRLLPITLEELEEEKSSGKWTTSFRLSGKARGATMNVSFGYVIENSGNTEVSCGKSVSEIPNLQRYSARAEKPLGPSDQMFESGIYRGGSLPARLSASNQSVEDMKDLHEVLPMPRSELLESMSILYQKMDEEASNTSIKNETETNSLSPVTDPLKVDLSGPPDAGEEACGTECEIAEFSCIDKGIEELGIEDLSPESEILKIAGGDDDGLEAYSANSPDHSQVEVSSQANEQSIQTCNYAKKEKEISLEETTEQEMESPLSCITDMVNEQLESQNEETDALHIESYLEADSNSKDCKKGKSPSFDYVADSVATDFLEMLGIDHSPFSMSSGSEPDSPRERLLRQFEKDALTNGGLLNFEDSPVALASDVPMGSSWGTFSEDFHHPTIFEGFEEMSKIETDAFMAKTRASRMEDLETESLMREWGLNEKAFQHSPPGGSAFGSPIHISPEDPQQLPPLAEGLGSFVQTRDGGFLRSMDPALFKNAKSGGSLIMQVSNPVVMPAVMGSGVMEILQGLASIGIEKLSMQANKLMPLEDLTGKTVQQIAWEGELCLEEPERFVLFIYAVLMIYTIIISCLRY